MTPKRTLAMTKKKAPNGKEPLVRAEGESPVMTERTPTIIEEGPS
jgi:hypothetical protein